jgi:UDP-N-acetylglucosamine 4,6-dehydratase
MRNVDYIFHAAALKQVPSCEFFPMEAIKTNVMGSKNVIDEGISQGVEKIICLSTDKAVNPINVMGMTKAMMEKLAISQSRFLDEGQTKICVTRYGNVMASRGSVIPLFLDQIKRGEPITITDLEMTRFVMTLDSAIELVLFALENGNNGDIFVQKSSAASIKVIYEAILELLQIKSFPVEILGHRHGEKKHETLISSEESLKTFDLGKYFKIEQDARDLNYSQYSESGVSSEKVFEYTSKNAKQLNKFELAKVLESLDFEEYR